MACIAAQASTRTESGMGVPGLVASASPGGTEARSKASPGNTKALRFVGGYLRRRFARFKLGAHFLDLRGLLLQLRNHGLHLAL